MPPFTPAASTLMKATPTGQRFGGIYKGQVVGAIDPAGQGRVQVSIPSLGIPPSWAQVCGSPSGSGIGANAVIGFLEGDPSLPVVLGFV